MSKQTQYQQVLCGYFIKKDKGEIELQLLSSRKVLENA